jgi:LPXTG-motif cell wall-anchored protein
MTGGTVIGATYVTTGADTLRLTLPGSQLGSSAPGGSAYFPGGQSFTSPELGTAITVGAAGTTLTGAITAMQLDAQIDIGTPPASSLLNVRLKCTPTDGSLGSGKVVTPPKPGAPNAVTDTAKTNKDTAVVVEVLKNDTPNAALAIDPASLKITAGPTSGTAVVNADRTVTYTPNPGFVGTDTLTYELCSVPSTDPAVPSGCDPADVTITVTDPTATAATTTPTTTAVAAAPTALPRTGGSSAPLAVIAGALLAFGAAALALTRTRRS